ncbi:unnamed protein product, partial [Amoebophrya sp. A120]|eukprot:GSA120T00012464001.1
MKLFQGIQHRASFRCTAVSWLVEKYYLARRISCGFYNFCLRIHLFRARENSLSKLLQCDGSRRVSGFLHSFSYQSIGIRIQVNKNYSENIRTSTTQTQHRVDASTNRKQNQNGVK